MNAFNSYFIQLIVTSKMLGGLDRNNMTYLNS
jgi:hypothetical protein